MSSPWSLYTVILRALQPHYFPSATASLPTLTHNLWYIRKVVEFTEIHYNIFKNYNWFPKFTLQDLLHVAGKYLSFSNIEELLENFSDYPFILPEDVCLYFSLAYGGSWWVYLYFFMWHYLSHLIGFHTVINFNFYNFYSHNR